MKLANNNDLPEIWFRFQQRKDIFPHVRKDYLQRMIASSQCIFQDGVIIIFHVYRKPTTVGNFRIPRGVTVLHQILRTGETRAREITKEFLNDQDGDTILFVRKTNLRARAFYESLGMSHKGSHSWSYGKLPGEVYIYEKTYQGPRPNPTQSI
jgi:hypothetical protein